MYGNLNIIPSLKYGYGSTFLKTLQNWKIKITRCMSSTFYEHKCILIHINTYLHCATFYKYIWINNYGVLCSNWGANVPRWAVNRTNHSQDLDKTAHKKKIKEK